MPIEIWCRCGEHFYGSWEYKALFTIENNVINTTRRDFELTVNETVDVLINGKHSSVEELMELTEGVMFSEQL